MSNTEKLKILIIDPWCGDESNLYYYTTGLAGGLSKYCEVTVISAYNCSVPSDVSYSIKNEFFKHSYSLRKGSKIRTLLKGVDYLLTYINILINIKVNEYDVIHVEWPVIYRLDYCLFSALKRKTRVFSYKAHNVLPHATGNRYIKVFKKIYSVPDLIFVHGESIKQEMADLYPELEQKIFIQRHGLYMNHDTSVNMGEIDKRIIDTCSNHSRIYLYCGYIHSDKGVDRLVEIWRRRFSDSKSILIIAGAISDAYTDFRKTEEIITECKNILFMPGFVEDNLLNYLLDCASLIILPYRKGSMSGVAFTAAEFKKAILATEFGTIREYITNNDTGYIVKNEDECLEKTLLQIENEVSNEELKKIGIRLNNSFKKEYNWDVIGSRLFQIYKMSINKN